MHRQHIFQFLLPIGQELYEYLLQIHGKAKSLLTRYTVASAVWIKKLAKIE